MKILNNINYNINQIPLSKLQQSSFKGATIAIDKFENNNEDEVQQENKEPSLLKQVFVAIVKILEGIINLLTSKPAKTEEVDLKPDKDNEPVVLSDFAKEIKEGLELETGKTYKDECFKSIMSPDELKEILPTLTAHNFRNNVVNNTDGIYCADLDYQTNFSNGKKNVFEILKEVKIKADQYVARQKEIQEINREAGLPVEEIKPFIFAITDRDCIESVQHAVRIIADDYKDYENVKFVPSLKLTYAHEADNSELKYENSEMLVYGVNPFSDNINTFIKDLIQRRKDMIAAFIKEIKLIYPELRYDILEFAEQNQIQYDKSFAESNLYWRVREYAESKGGNELKGKPINQLGLLLEAEDLLSDLRILKAGDDRQPIVRKGHQIISDDNAKFNDKINSIFRKYSTHEENGIVKSPAENLYEDMIECLSKEKEKPIIALASPVYLSHYYGKRDEKVYPDVVRFIKKLQEKSNGMLIAFESIAPRYGLDNILSRDTIKQFNKYIREYTDLFEVGGSFDGEKTN